MNTTKQYTVELPITGYVSVTVEAENAKAAIEKALGVGVTTKNIEQWEVVRRIVQGNVFYGELNEPRVYDEDGNDIDPDEDEEDDS